jgi:putative transposase
VDRRPTKNCKYLSVSISKNCSDQYFAAVLVQEEQKQLIKTGNSCGIDLGLSYFLTTSDGKQFENPNYLRESQTKIAKVQKRLSRKKKGSSRYKKTRIKLAKLHEKVANQRKWFHHQVSLDLVRSYDLIGIEDLNISGMVKNKRLAKSISDAGWSQFVNFLKYKASWNDKEVVKVGRYFASSKTCCKCGFKKASLKLSERVYKCDECGNIMDRDINAAKNIKSEAIRLTQGVACV